MANAGAKDHFALLDMAHFGLTFQLAAGERY